MAQVTDKIFTAAHIKKLVMDYPEGCLDQKTKFLESIGAIETPMKTYRFIGRWIGRDDRLQKESDVSDNKLGGAACGYIERYFKDFSPEIVRSGGNSIDFKVPAEHYIATETALKINDTLSGNTIFGYLIEVKG